MPKKPTYEALEHRVRELESIESQYKKMFEEQQQKEKRYQHLFENMLHEVHVWQLVYDDSGNIKTWRLVDANPAALKSWGKALPDIVGKTTDDIFPNSNATELFLPVVTQIFSEGKPHMWESYFPDTNQFLHMISVPFGDYFISTGFDITERKQAEKVLHRNNEMLKRTEAIAHVGSWEWEIATDTVTWSEELYRIFQFDPDEKAPGWAEHSNLYHPEDYTKLRQAVETAISDGIPYELELRAFREDGESKTCIAKGFPETKEDGQVVRLYGLLQDMTERKQAENELKKSQEQLSELTNQLPGVIYQFYSRPDGKMGLYYVSGKAEEIFGLKADLDGFFERFTELVIPEYKQKFLQSIQKVTEEVIPWHFEGVLQKPTGERIWFGGHSAPSIRDTEVVFNGIILDITDQKKNEILLENINTDLKLAQRIASLGTWTFDPEVGVPEWSEGIYRIYERDPHLGPYPLDEYKKIYHGKWFKRFHSAIQDAMINGIPYDIELRLEVPSGKVKWIHAICEPESKAGPKGHKLRGTIQDITELKQTAIALEESKNRYESIYQNAQAGLGRVNVRDGRVIECNPEMARIFGFNDIKTFIDEFLISDNYVEKDFREHFIRKLKENGSLSNVEAQLYRKDGEKIWIRFDSRIFPEQGYKEDVLIDITKQKKLESEKEAEHKELISIFDGMDEVIYVSDPDTYELLYSNEAFNKNWGKRIHGKCHIVLQNRETPCPFCTNHLIFGENIGVTHIWEFQNEVTKQWYRCTDRAIKWPDGRMVRLEIATDISKQIESQIHLQITKDRLESLWSIARLADADINILCDHVLEEVKKITESEYAFLGFLSDDENSMELHAWSKNAMADCTVANQSRHFPIDNAGIWSESVRRKQIITLNDFQQNHPGKKGVPEGHVQLTRMMAVPLETNGQIVSIATVANKKTAYTPEDERQVSAFLNNVQILIDRKKKEETLLRQQETISLNNKIANVFLTSSEDDIFADTLDVILETLESPFGYFGFIDDDGNLNCPSMTRNIWEKCEVPDKSIVFTKDIWGGLWGDSLKKVKTIIANDGLTFPEGHIQLECAMAVPIIHHEELIGQFVVADKQGGYDQYERRLLESAALQTAPILNSLLEKKAQEREHKRMQARIEQAQKMESIGNLAGGIAHDFNNILVPIIGMSELLIEDLETDSFEYENAQAIYTAGNRAKDLVKQILSFSRQTEHEKMPVKLQKILKEVLKLCRSSIPTTIEIKQDIQLNCGSILANATQLHQIGMNLITNAYHAVQDKNGKIIVRLKEFTLEKKDKSFLSIDSGKYALLSVSDNGTGMPEKIKSKIFEPYFTTKEKGKGTGLGLAVVYGIVKDFGGDVQVLSRVGAGTTFNIYLPLMKKTGHPGIDKSNTDIQTGDEHILLVDDEPAIARLIQLILERLGYAVTARVSSIEAMEAFKKNPDRFDMVISDMSMPYMAGDELSYEIRQIRPEIPIIICTGFSERINKEKAEKIGVNGFLMKPILKSDMAEMVRKVLDEARP